MSPAAERPTLLLSHHDLAWPALSLAGAKRGQEEGRAGFPGLGNNEQGRGSQALPNRPAEPGLHLNTPRPFLVKTVLSCNFLEAETVFKIYSIFSKAQRTQTELFLLH